MPRTQLAYIQKGNLGQYETWWYLDEDDQGNFSVIREFDDVRIGTLEHSEGKSTHTVEWALEHGPTKVIEALKQRFGRG